MLPWCCNVYFRFSSVQGRRDMGIQWSALALLIRKKKNAWGVDKTDMSEWESLRITEMSKDRREGSKENSRAQRDTVEKKLHHQYSLQWGCQIGSCWEKDSIREFMLWEMILSRKWNCWEPFAPSLLLPGPFLLHGLHQDSIFIPFSCILQGGTEMELRPRHGWCWSYRIQVILYSHVFWFRGNST